jgi:F0F1-type ATP synthase assembly protein I
MRDPRTDQSGRKLYFRNMALAVLAGQVGCLTLIIVLVAVFAGLWLDARFDTKPVYTIGLLLASIPVSLIAMFFVARAAISRIKAGTPQKHPVRMEEDDLGDNH